MQFSISTQFRSIWPIGRTLSGVTTLGQSEPGSDVNKRVLCIPQSSRLFTIRLFSVINRTFTVISRTLSEEVLVFCRDAVSVFYSPSWLGHPELEPHHQMQFRVISRTPFLGEVYSSAGGYSLLNAANRA